MEKSTKQYKTGYKFYPTSFIKGMGSIFCLSGNYYKFKIGRQSEFASETFANDWKMIAQAMEKALSKLSKK